nr:hypothetical protein [uncultured Cohaesibacter sp.]
MSLYFDPDRDEARSGPIFDIPERLVEGSEIMHAASLVIGRVGILIRGATGSGKSLLQRHLRQVADQNGLYAALISDDYVRLSSSARLGGCPPSLIAFAPVATRRLQEVRGFGVTEISRTHHLSRAVMHLLVDLTNEEEMARMPSQDEAQIEVQAVRIDHLRAPERQCTLANDLIFARLSTWKAGE